MRKTKRTGQAEGVLAAVPPARDFWQPKTLQELAAEQGVRPLEHLEDALGRGARLWDGDAELDRFLTGVRRRRRARR